MRKRALKPTGSLVLATILALVLGFSLTALALRAGTSQVSASAWPSSFSVEDNTLGDLEIKLTPVGAVNQTGAPHTLTATVSTTGDQPAAGIEVTFQVITGPSTGVDGSGVTGVDGTVTFTYTSHETGVDTIAACFADDSGEQACALAVKQWTGEVAAFKIDLKPAKDRNPVGTSHTLTARVRAGTTPVTGAEVTFLVTDGPAQGAGGVSDTDAEGKARFTYSSSTPGQDTIRACVADPNVEEVCATATKTWFAPEEPPISRDSCQGDNSCRGKNISVGENSCNADNACNGNDLTIGDNSCNQEDACRGNGNVIGDDSCNGEESCRGNHSATGAGSCNEDESCNGNNSRIGNRSCNGDEACNGNNISIGTDSCNAEEACNGHNGSVGDNTCNTEEACPGRGPKDNDNQRGRDRDDDDDDDDEDDGDDDEGDDDDGGKSGKKENGNGNRGNSGTGNSLGNLGQGNQQDEQSKSKGSQNRRDNPPGKGKSGKD